MTITLAESTRQLALIVGEVFSGVATGGSATTLDDTACTDFPDDFWIGGTIWLTSGNGYPQRAIGYMDAVVRWDLFSDTRPAVGAYTVTLPVTTSTSWTVAGYILEAETEVVVVNAQNRPEWVKEVGVLVYSGGVTGQVTTPAGATWPTV